MSEPNSPEGVTPTKELQQALYDQALTRLSKRAAEEPERIEEITTLEELQTWMGSIGKDVETILTLGDHYEEQPILRTFGNKMYMLTRPGLAGLHVITSDLPDDSISISFHKDPGVPLFDVQIPKDPQTLLNGEIAPSAKAEDMSERGNIKRYNPKTNPTNPADLTGYARLVHKGVNEIVLNKMAGS